MTRRALLVGCNYPGTEDELQGCWNDAYALRDRLVSRFDFDQESICVLVDKPGTSPQFMPTGANIREKLYALIRNLKGGDSVVLHFSGHGVQMPPEGEPDETGYKECIVPTDMNLITDDDFRIFVDQIPDGVNFTFIADCCHSGGLIAHAEQQVGSVVSEPDLLSTFSLLQIGDQSGNSQKQHKNFSQSVKTVDNLLRFSTPPHVHGSDPRYASGQHGYFGGQQQTEAQNQYSHPRGYGSGPNLLCKYHSHPGAGNSYTESQAAWDQGQLESRASYPGVYAPRHQAYHTNNYHINSGGDHRQQYQEHQYGSNHGGFAPTADGINMDSHKISAGLNRHPPYYRQPCLELGYSPAVGETQWGMQENYHTTHEAVHTQAWPYVGKQSAGYGQEQFYESASFGTKNRSLSVDKLIRMLSQRAGRKVEVGNIRTNLYDLFTDKSSVTCKAVVKTVLEGFKERGVSRVLNRISSKTIHFLRSKLDDPDVTPDDYFNAVQRPASILQPEGLSSSGLMRGIREHRDRCVLVTACQSDEAASDCKPVGGGSAYGAFSNAILSILDEHKGPIDNFRIVSEARHRLSKEHDQHPCLYSTPEKAHSVFICY